MGFIRKRLGVFNYTQAEWDRVFEDEEIFKQPSPVMSTKIRNERYV